ncbi:MAG: amidohydrolase family protein [Thermomicrobiales bacterium]
MAQLDLVIRNGRVVTESMDTRTDVGISDGKVVQIGGDMQGEKEIDAGGKLVIPGGIDAHVHVTSQPGKPEPRWVDDFTSGSAAALAGGITTIGNMTQVTPGETPLEGLAREAEQAGREAIADVLLHPIFGNAGDAALADVPHLLENGHNSVKFFMSTPTFDAQSENYLELVRRAGNEQLITLIHCEDYPLIQDATRELVAAGKSSLRHYAESRPIVSEVVATQRAIAFCEATGAPVYIVHLSCERALAVCAEAQARGLPVYVETRPLYLHLTKERFEEEDGAKYVGQPPLREPSDVDAIWAGIRSGAVSTVCTDHAPWSLAAKLDPELSIENLRPGTENLQVMLPMLYSEGVRTGRISLQKMIQVLSTNAARLFGLYPQKGTIAPGSDADIVIFDPDLTRTITGSMLESNADYSVFEGWEITGWPVTTIRRGDVVFENDEMTGQPGTGILPRRGPTMAL